MFYFLNLFVCIIASTETSPKLSEKNTNIGIQNSSIVDIKELDSFKNPEIETNHSKILQEDEKSNDKDICKSATDVYDDIINNAKEDIVNIQREIEEISALLDEIKENILKKQEELEQAHKYSKLVDLENDLNKMRYKKRDIEYEKNIQTCQQALVLLNKKSSNVKNNLSKELSAIAEDSLNPVVHALITLSVLQNPEYSETIKILLQTLLDDLWISRINNKYRYETIIQDAQTLSEERNMIYNDAIQENNLIISKQIQLQQELYHKRLEVNDQKDRLNNTIQKKDLLYNLCIVEKKLNKYKSFIQTEDEKKRSFFSREPEIQSFLE